MFNVFLICAVVGGTIFVVQFVLAIVGFGAEDLDFADDLPDDLPDDIGDIQGDVLDHGSTALFGVISFRTVVAAITFFGLAGVAAMQAGQTNAAALLIASGVGVVAMYGVHYLMRLLYRLGGDGTVRIERSVGARGKVYVPIPANRSGAGKVQLRLQGRLVEYEAMTSEAEKLPTGARISVVSVISPTTVEVERVGESVQAADADVEA